jgi:hypothetical protein
MMNFKTVYTGSVVVVMVILLGICNGLVVELGWWRQIFNGGKNVGKCALRIPRIWKNNTNMEPREMSCESGR